MSSQYSFNSVVRNLQMSQSAYILPNRHSFVIGRHFLSKNPIRLNFSGQNFQEFFCTLSQVQMARRPTQFKKELESSMKTGDVSRVEEILTAHREFDINAFCFIGAVRMPYLLHDTQHNEYPHL